MKFRKKPIVIEAYQFNGPSSCVDWPYEFAHAVFTETSTGEWRICTLEGELTVSKELLTLKADNACLQVDLERMTHDRDAYAKAMAVALRNGIFPEKYKTKEEIERLLAEVKK
mgnify:CR=1 FL=1